MDMQHSNSNLERTVQHGKLYHSIYCPQSNVIQPVAYIHLIYKFNHDFVRLINQVFTCYRRFFMKQELTGETDLVLTALGTSI